MTTYMLQGYGRELPCTQLADALLEAEPPIGTIAVSAFEQELPTWRVEAYYDYEPDEQAITDLIHSLVGNGALNWKLVPLDDQDWVAKGLEDLPPVSAGRYVIFGEHDKHKVPVNAVGLHIEASAAFGTGHHHTTRGCLLALEAVVRRHSKNPSPIMGEGGAKRRMRVNNKSIYVSPSPPCCAGTLSHYGRGVSRVLDLGTGTGVLGFAALKSFPHSKAVLSDNDIHSVRIAKENAVFNHVKARSTIVEASGTQHPAIRSNAPYDLVFANILAPVLIMLAGDIAKVTHSGSIIILSGLLNWQARWVFGAYQPRGFKRLNKVVLGDWTTLVLEKS